MKLLNFQFGTGGTSLFGVVIKGHGVSFKTLLHKSGQTRGELSGVYSYLENLPSSEDAARELMKYGEANSSSLNAEEKITLEKVRILAPISTPRALIDFGLSPRHLGNSAATLIKHEFGIFGSIIASIVKKRISVAAGSSHRSTAGFLEMARASATRCCSPPESWAGK